MSGTSEKGSEYKRERYYFLKAHGICTKCGCADAVLNRTLCADCLYKSNERAAKRRNAMTAEEKKRQIDWIREYRRKLVSQGLCVECGKPQCKYSRSRCYEHWLANNRRNRESYQRTKPEKPVVKYACKDKPPRKPAANHPWILDNRIIFRRKV